MDKSCKFVRLRQGMVVSALLFVCSYFTLCWSLNDEGVALLRFRERVVKDPFGALSNWNDDDGEVDPCFWYGVGCSGGKVVELILKDLCLEGTLAPELRNLVHIKSIILRNNIFSGTIPDGLGKLKELEELDLGYNNFSSPLPRDLGNNLSLTILLLDNNELLGGLSPEIYELQQLSEAQVDEKKLSNDVKTSCTGKRYSPWNAIQTGDTVYRRLLIVDNANISNNSTAPNSPSKSPLPSASVSPTTNQTTPVPEPEAPALSPTVPPIFPSPQQRFSPGSNTPKFVILVVSIGAAIVLLILIVGIVLFRNKTISAVKPWRTGLSGQLQKVFITGVPKLKRSELEAACEDFSNVIGSSPIGTVNKGTLSSGVEIAVVSVAVTSIKDWSANLEVQFRKKIDTLSKVNHKNFVNLLGYCEEDEPFTRMMVFEYAPNGTLFEHLHIRESEHLNWGMRLRIAMGMAYCLEHMHQLDPPVIPGNLISSSIQLTEDYAAKISDFSFWTEMAAAEMEKSVKQLTYAPSISPESNVYSFGVLLFEMMTGRLPYSLDDNLLENWASDYLTGVRYLREMVDRTVKSFDEKQLEDIGELIKLCVNPEPAHRPTMKEVTARLREITGLAPDESIPKLSPLWWAELEILSTEAA